MGLPTNELEGPLPFDLEERVLAEVGQGENVAWIGRPRPFRVVLPSILISALGAMFTAFAAFWIVMVSQAKVPAIAAFFPLFGIPFILVGLSMLAAPGWAYYSACRTVYAVTDRRAVIFEPRLLAGLSVVSLGPADLTPIERVERGDGSGDLTFGTPITLGYNKHGRPRLLYRRFIGIPQVREVESLIRRTLLDRDETHG